VLGSGSTDSRANGLAEILGWQLGPAPVQNILEADALGFPVIQFTATAVP